MKLEGNKRDLIGDFELNEIGLVEDLNSKRER